MITATLTRPADALRQLSDLELAEAYAAGRVSFADLERECSRRDGAERRAATVRARQDAWFDSAHAQYLEAVSATNGYLLSPAGNAAVDAGKLRGEFDLWRVSASDVERYASEELCEFFYNFPRITRGEYAREIAASKRAELEAWRAERAPVVRPLAAPARPLITIRRLPPIVAAPALELPTVTRIQPARLVTAPMQPGAIARYMAGLQHHAERADSLAARMLAAHRKLTERQAS